jgi:polyhydroxybutyrate depolymerase
VEIHALSRPEGERRYLLFPAAARPGPAIVFLAGTGCTAEWAADETRLPEFALAAGFHLVLPEAQRPHPAEPARFLHNPPRWNDGSPAPTPPLKIDVDDASFLNALFDDLIALGLADAKNIFLTGFSNGAGMTFLFASECAERLAAIAPIAGLWFQLDKVPSRPLPTFYLLGDVDPLIPYRGGEVHLPWGNRLVHRPAAKATLEAWAAAIGCEPHSIVMKEADGIREEIFPNGVEFRAIFVEALGHHWPGGKGQLNPRIAGPLNATLNLNPLLLAFFRKHLR